MTLEDVRKENKLSRTALAKIMGASRMSVWRYEHGVCVLPVEQAKRIGEKFGFEWWKLFEN